MAVLPTKQTEVVAFAQEHLEGWSANAAAIGLTAAEVAAAVPLMNAAAGSVTAAGMARNASKSATMTQTESVRTLRQSLAGLVRKIKDFAEGSADPMEVYARAEIPAPAAPSYNTPPTRAFELSAELDFQTGFLSVKWKASQPQGISGVVYLVYRSITGASGVPGPLTQVGATGEKTFVDVAVPAGTRQCVYQVQAQRGSLTSGFSNALQVNFGVPVGTTLSGAAMGGMGVGGGFSTSIIAARDIPVEGEAAGGGAGAVKLAA